jgi:broad specificity phosphatase PhoE
MLHISFRPPPLSRVQITDKLFRDYPHMAASHQAISLRVPAGQSIGFPAHPVALSSTCGDRTFAAPSRVILVRHGRPAVPMSPRTCYRGFRDFIDAYEQAGLDPGSAPPAELLDLVRGLCEVFTSAAPRATESARSLLPAAAIIADPLFAEAPLAGPRIPLIKLRVPIWAVLSRILWHAGYHPRMENYSRARCRAARAADKLLAAADANSGIAVLVAHGYFNAMIGRVLRQRGFVRAGTHRANFWNAVSYQRGVA